MNQANMRLELESLGIGLNDLRNEIDVILHGLYSKEPNPDLPPNVVKGLCTIIEGMSDRLYDEKERMEKLARSLDH